MWVLYGFNMSKLIYYMLMNKKFIVNEYIVYSMKQMGNKIKYSMKFTLQQST